MTRFALLPPGVCIHSSAKPHVKELFPCHTSIVGLSHPLFFSCSFVHTFTSIRLMYHTFIILDGRLCHQLLVCGYIVSLAVFVLSFVKKLTQMWHRSGEIMQAIQTNRQIKPVTLTNTNGTRSDLHDWKLAIGDCIWGVTKMTQKWPGDVKIKIGHLAVNERRAAKVWYLKRHTSKATVFDLFSLILKWCQS